MAALPRYEGRSNFSAEENWMKERKKRKTATTEVRDPRLAGEVFMLYCA